METQVENKKAVEDRWDGTHYILNGNEYSHAVAVSYMEALCNFSSTEAEAYLAMLKG